LTWSQFIFMSGARWRNPSLMKQYHSLKQTEKYSLEQLADFQSARLMEFLTHSANNSPYHRDYFISQGWTPGDPVTLDDFHKMPVMEKDILIGQNHAIHAHGISEKLFFCETSGTSGAILTFRRNELWDSFNRASIMRGYTWHGVNPWDRSIYFWGYNYGFRKRMISLINDRLLNRIRIFQYDEPALRKLLKNLKEVVYIEGYSSMIYELACMAEYSEFDCGKLKMIKGTSEKIYDHYSDKTRSVFGHKIISEYGAAETGIIAFECRYGNMHINMEGVYVETDESNEIIVTNMMSYSFPVIRYRLGDAVKIRQNNQICGCGLNHPVIEEVTGRVGKNIYGISGKYPSLVLYYIFKSIYFDKGVAINYQAHQNVKGNLEIWTKEQPDDQLSSLILEYCFKYFGEDMNIKIWGGKKFIFEKGKLKDFISSVI